MTSKTNNKVRWIPSLVAAIIISMGAIMKLAGTQALVEVYSRIGLRSWMPVLGIVEIVLVILFLVPRTMKLGFLLLTGFFGGAMAVEFSHGSVFIYPAVILSIVWIGAWFRNSSLFLNRAQTQMTASY